MTKEELKQLPKVELHCHLDGSLSREFIEKRLGRQVSQEELTVSDDCTNTGTVVAAPEIASAAAIARLMVFFIS